MVYKTFFGSAFAGKGIGLWRSCWDRNGLSSRVRRPPLFMCRIYLVAYKFRFDFILWREPSASCTSDRSADATHPSLMIVAHPQQQALTSVATLLAIPTFNNQRPIQTQSLFYSSTGSFAIIQKASRTSRSSAYQLPEGQTISLPSSRTEKSRKPIVASKIKPGVS